MVSPLFASLKWINADPRMCPARLSVKVMPLSRSKTCPNSKSQDRSSIAFSMRRAWFWTGSYQSYQQLIDIWQNEGAAVPPEKLLDTPAVTA